MRTINDIDPNWTTCKIDFEGCGNASWLVKLPVNNPNGPTELELQLNHPWTTEIVTVKYAGRHKKRPEVHLYKQVPKRKLFGSLS